jgi:uncharacterized protein
MRALTIISLLIFSVVAHGADPDDTPATRLAAAEKYYATLDIAKLMDQVLAKDAASLPEDNREQARVLVREHFHYQELTKVSLQALVKIFNTKELNAMAAFYGSAEGQSVISKYPAYLAEVMPAIVAQVRRTMAEVQPELQSKRGSQAVR